jgi:SanA protein
MAQASFVSSRLHRRLLRTALSAAVAFVAFVVVLTALAVTANQVMTSWSKAYATDDLGHLPQVDVALVLGTLPYFPPGRLNPGLRNRLDAAVDLWRAGKVKYLIVSGNRDGDGYDEPTIMRDVLVARGVPPDVIYRDFAGLRTVTSIVRARDIYGQKRFIIVSQRDHLDRALYLARHLGVEAWGYDARGSVPFMMLRSMRAKLIVLYAFWDLVAGPRPADGPRVAIGVDPPG